MTEPIVRYGVYTSSDEGAAMLIEQHERIVRDYRQIIAILLGITDVLDEANGWGVFRESVRNFMASKNSPASHETGPGKVAI